MGFILFLVAIILSVILYPIGFIFGLFAEKTNDYFYRIAYSIDQNGNVVCAAFFNAIFIKMGGVAFGNPDETVSSVLGKNKERGTLTRTGRFLDRILEKLDNGHSLNAIERDEVWSQ
jgi:hypothetical protein